MKTRTMGAVIKQLREERSLTQSDLAKTIGVSSSTIGMWENDERSPNEDKKEIIADYFNVDMNYLYGKTLIRNSYRELGQIESTDNTEVTNLLNVNFIKVPLYNDISCGNGAFVDDNIIDYVSVPDDNMNSSVEYFAQKAKGDSMQEAGIEDGDICVFEKTNTIEDNKIGCFCIDDGIATCKKFKKGTSFIQLIPMNRAYDPIVIDLQDSNFRILGKLKKAIKEFD